VGHTARFNCPCPSGSWEQRQTGKEAVAEIDRLLDLHTYPEIAAILNDGGVQSGEGQSFSARTVARVQRSYGLKSRYDRLRAACLLTLDEMAQVLGITPTRVKIWLRQGLIHGHPYDAGNACLYEHPGAKPPRPAMGEKLSKRLPVSAIVSARPQEVQYEA